MDEFDFDMQAQEAIKSLGKLALYKQSSFELANEYTKAVSRRTKRILHERTIDDIEATELRTRESMIRRALESYEYELRAFINATMRHEKDRTGEE